MIEEIEMSYEPQRLITPDGTELVVITAERYEELLDAFEDLEDVAAAKEAIRETEEAGGWMPGEVLHLMDEGISPIAAWRRHRGLSQAELARRAGISQVWLGRIESGAGFGKPKVREALAAALDAPLWTLDFNQDEPDSIPAESSAPTRFPSKSAHIRHLLDKGLPRADIARQVGVRYQFVRNVDIARAR